MLTNRKLVDQKKLTPAPGLNYFYVDLSFFYAAASKGLLQRVNVRDIFFILLKVTLD